MDFVARNRHLGSNSLGNDDASSPASLASPLDSIKLEIVIVRVGLPVVVALALSVADIPDAVPPSMAFSIGMIAISLCIALPKQAFIIGAIFPVLVAAIVMSLAAGSLLLAASTVSDGMLVTAFTLWTIFISGFYFGEYYDKLSPVANILIAMGGILALSLKPMVQEGFTFPLSNEVQGGILDLVCAALTIPAENCSIENLPRDSFSFEIPEYFDSMLAGQTVTVQFGGGGGSTSSFINVEGGMWVVRGLWTWSGTTNPLAIFQNLLICIGWTLAIMAVSILIPPVRCRRDQLSQTLVPGALLQASEILQQLQKEQQNHHKDHHHKHHQNREHPEHPEHKEHHELYQHHQHHQDQSATNLEEHHDKKDTKKEDSTNPSGMAIQLPSFEEREKEGRLQQYQSLIHCLASMNGGKGATIILFEPRLLRAPTENLAPKLKVLMACASRAILASLILQPNDYYDRGNHPGNGLGKMTRVLNASASALTKNDESLLLLDDDDSKDGKGVNVEARKDEEQAQDAQDIADHMLGKYAEEMVEATRTWVHAMNHPEPIDCGAQGWKNIASVYVPWIMIPMLLVLQQLQILISVFKAKEGGRQARAKRLANLIWMLYLVGGYVALFSMSVFWGAYSNFAIELPKGNVGAVFSGWQLIAYAFVWQPTLEGTLGKGIARIVGTALGGFSGWLGCIVCSGSYDEFAPLNPYAVVAWLTVTTCGCAWVCTSKGEDGLSGLNKDVGSFGIYYTATQALIVLDVLTGSGTRSDLVLNRTVATITGCTMAILLAMLPPYVRGNDPRWIHRALRECQRVLAHILRDLLDNKAPDNALTNSDDKKYQESTLEPALQALRVALFLQKDAGNLKVLRFLHVNPRLMAFADDVTVVISLLGHIIELVLAEQACRTKSDNDNEGGGNATIAGPVRLAIKELIEYLEREADSGDGDEPASKSLPLPDLQKCRKFVASGEDDDETHQKLILAILSASRGVGLHLQSSLTRVKDEY